VLMRSADIISLTVRSGRRDALLLDLFDSWAAHVLHLVREVESFDPKQAWGAHDFLAAVYIRDRLDKGLAGTGGTLAPVEVTDELFRRFTRPHGERSLRLLDPDVPDGPWWWRRVPTAGPVADELSDLHARLRGDDAARGSG
jgi:hypothetical protein